MKKYGIAVLLSAIFPGAGQLYNRSWVKGALFIIITFVLTAELRRHVPVSAILAGNPQSLSGTNLLFLALTLATALWSVIDAYRFGKKKPSE